MEMETLQCRQQPMEGPPRRWFLAAPGPPCPLRSFLPAPQQPQQFDRLLTPWEAAEPALGPGGFRATITGAPRGLSVFLTALPPGSTLCQ